MSNDKKILAFVLILYSISLICLLVYLLVSDNYPTSDETMFYIMTIGVLKFSLFIILFIQDNFKKLISSKNLAISWMCMSNMSTILWISFVGLFEGSTRNSRHGDLKFVPFEEWIYRFDFTIVHPILTFEPKTILTFSMRIPTDLGPPRSIKLSAT